jgi:signal transduction histidine kinase/phage shock protein PspC (stress-responsive transcriptional regulator)
MTSMLSPKGEPLEPRRATRDTEDVWLGGVASGLARHLGLPTLWVRVAFIVMVTFGGFGVALYAGLWMTLPSDAKFATAAPGLESASRGGRRPRGRRRIADLGPVVALGALGLGVVLLAQAAFGHGVLFWPVLLGILGLAVLWRQADEAQRERWLHTTDRINPVQVLIGDGSLASWARLAAGVLLVSAALSLFAIRSGSIGAARDVLLATLLGIVGITLTVGPWIFRLASDLAAERAERVRTQDRADVAAHLHDSVLQTLALIQKNAADSTAVARLARSQERDLRSWLYDDRAPAAESLAAALRAAAAEIEDAHGASVDVVTVGDAPMSTHLESLVLATREAVVNAAKHAGSGQVSVYAEASPAAAQVFVRDRGVGFDLAVIASDRQGVRGSIVDRMTRHGGTAEVLSTPGEGTEVRLTMPLTTEEKQ